MKKVNLEWYVLFHDFNADKIVKYNVLNDSYIIDSVKKAVKKQDIKTFAELKDFIAHKFKAQYWSRAEYEIFVSGLITRAEAQKIDVWFQIEMNLDNITEYLINKLKLNIK